MNNLTEKQFILIKDLEFDRSSIVELLDWSPNKIKFRTNTLKPQLLILSEINYPGWEINKDINIIEINGMFRGLIVPQGENEYVMKFKPWDIRAGNIITILVYIILSTNIIIIYYRKKNV